MIGKFATSKAGHDKAQVYVIIAMEDDFVYLCDGRLKPLGKPKKKRKKHIQIVNTTVEQDLYNRILNKETVRDEEIKYAIRKYIEAR
ncbi:MAG: hypothetical protein J6A94_08000 [Lachnospiraceae bacterium]|nr:hypothetical protein [Lachnospiraceae bacterium]